MIPFLDLNTFYNPGKMLEEYLEFLPSKDDEALLFPLAKLTRKGFNVLDPKKQVLFYLNRKIGRNIIRQMLPELCIAAGVERSTNHQGMSNFIKIPFLS